MSGNNEKLKEELKDVSSEKGTRKLIDKHFNNEPMGSSSNTLLIYDYYDDNYY